MKILLAAKHPPGGKVRIGGLQSWIVTVSRALEARGHECLVWGPEFEIASQRFDLGILANIKWTEPVAVLCDRVLNITHGIIPAEKPEKKYPTASTSEEVCAHWQLSGPVIRQPIDLDIEWTPDGPKVETEANSNCLVLYSYRAVQLSPFRRLAKDLNYPFLHVKGVSQAQAAMLLRGAKLVCASGRAALEAMALGAPTLIYDHRLYNGPEPLLVEDLNTARFYNYSGRGGMAFDAQSVVRVAQNIITAGSRRNYIRQWHDVERIIEGILHASGFDADGKSG